MFAGSVGFGTMLVDLAFHTLLTAPEETALYFGAKFVLAFVVGFAFYDASDLLGSVLGGVAFDVLTGVYYWFAYYLSSSVLSCCFLSPPQVYGVPLVVFFSVGGYQVSSWLLAFIAVHFVAFSASFLVVRYLLESDD